MQINHGIDIVALDAEAVTASVRLAAAVTAGDLDRPTPCAHWTLRGLLAHTTAQHDGFAAAAAGDGDPARWRLPSLATDPVGAYQAAAGRALTAFAADGVLGREFPLPEIRTAPPFPARQAISFHFVDYVVHSWDVARTIGQPVSFEPALLDAALAVARAVPAGSSRRAPGAAFAPPVVTGADAALDRIVAVLGRSPDWKRPQISD